MKTFESVIKGFRNDVYSDADIEITNDQFQEIVDTILEVFNGKLNLFLVTYLANWADMISGYDINYDDHDLDDIDTEGEVVALMFQKSKGDIPKKPKAKLNKRL